MKPFEGGVIYCCLVVSSSVDRAVIILLSIMEIIINLQIFSSLCSMHFLLSSDSGERCRFRLFDKHSLFNKTEGEMQRIESSVASSK